MTEEINIKTLNCLNFGDAINTLFWKILTNGKIYHNNNELYYLTTGSIMCLADEKSIIFELNHIDH